MALPSPDTGQFKQDVVVNGLRFHQYARLASYLDPGRGVLLVSDPSNIHDANAVKVCIQAGAQIGWVPKLANHEISRRLKAGEVLTAEVIEHSPVSERLVIRVLGAEPKSPPVASKHLGIIDTLKEPSADTARFKDWKLSSTLTVFRLRTSPNRASVSVVSDLDDEDIAWFRKEHMSDAAIRHAEAGQLYGVKCANGNLALYPKASLPDSVSLPQKQQQAATGGAIFDGATLGTRFNVEKPTQPQKETTMLNNIKQTAATVVDNNKSAAAQAGYLEAGRIANNQFSKLAAKSLPMMLRGYADTAVGKLVIANIAQIAAGQLRPNDVQLARLTAAMNVAAYQSVIQTVDIEGWLNQLMDSPEITRALGKLPAAGDAE